MRTKNISDPISSMSTEIRELSVEELDAVSGGEVRVIVTPAESMAELYQQWADLGGLLKEAFKNCPCGRA